MTAYEAKFIPVIDQYNQAQKEIAQAVEERKRSTEICEGQILLPETLEMLTNDGFDIILKTHISDSSHILRYNIADWENAELGKQGEIIHETHEDNKIPNLQDIFKIVFVETTTV